MTARTPMDIAEYDLAENYPMMRDVIDAKPGKMEGLDGFLHQWREALSDQGLGWRTADLLLEDMGESGCQPFRTAEETWRLRLGAVGSD